MFSPLMGRTDLTPIDADVVALQASSGGGSARQWNELSQSKNRPVYAMNFQFSGPAKVVDAKIETVRDLYSSWLSGLAFTDGRTIRAPLDENTLDEPQKNLFGIPTMWRFLPDLSSRNWTGHVWFSPNIPRTGEAIRKAQEVFRAALQPDGFVWGWQGGLPTFPKTNTLLHSFNITKDPAENKKAREAFLRLVAAAAEQGWSEYRTAPAFMDAIMDIFSFNNHALLRFHETIKDAVDPNGILSAGRYGIWPKHLRKARV